MKESSTILYLRVEITAPLDTDPMQGLSDVALWAECRLTHDDIEATHVTAYRRAEDIALDEADGVFGAPVPRPRITAMLGAAPLDNSR
jgi:hypothetical protein